MLYICTLFFTKFYTILCYEVNVTTNLIMNFISRYQIILWDKHEPIPRSQLLSKIPGVDALYCVLTDKIDGEILDAAGPQLKIVASMSVGVDHLDLNALKKRSIRVGYTPDVLTEATAELIVGLLLATSRKLLQANKAIYKYVFNIKNVSQTV